jgi:hypothetical protein
MTVEKKNVTIWRCQFLVAFFGVAKFFAAYARLESLAIKTSDGKANS